MRGGPAGRQPGADRPHEPRAQEAHVRAAGAAGLQGDRGRLPLGEPDRLRLRPRAHRAGPGPRRRRDPGPDPGPRPAHRAHLRVDPRRPAGDRAPLQLDVDAAAPGRVRAAARGHRRHRGAGRPAVPQAHRDGQGHRGPLRVLTRVLHRHRARLRGRGLQRGQRHLAAHARPQGDHQPAGDGGDGHAQRLRRLDRVDAPQPGAPRLRRAVPAPPQRPGHGGGRGRAGLHGRRGPHRGLPVRQRRAHGQRLPGDAGHEPLRPGDRPADRLQRHRRDPPDGRVLQPAAGQRAPPLRRRPRLHRLLRLAPGRHQEGPGVDAARRRRGRGAGGRAPVGRAVPADRPEGRGSDVRGGHPGQLAVGQGRRRLRHEDRAPARPAAPPADRVQPGHPGAHRRVRR